MQNVHEHLFLQNISGGSFWKLWIYSIHDRFTQGLVQLLFTFFNWKTSKLAYCLIQFFISYRDKFLKPIRFITQYCLLLLNVFLFLSTFSVFLNDYFFRWLAYKSCLSRFSVLKITLGFPGSRFFRVQVQGLGFRSSPTLLHLVSYIEEQKMWK